MQMSRGCYEQIASVEFHLFAAARWSIRLLASEIRRPKPHSAVHTPARRRSALHCIAVCRYSWSTVETPASLAPQLEQRVYYERSTVVDTNVCLSVCLHAYLSNYMSEL